MAAAAPAAEGGVRPPPPAPAAPHAAAAGSDAPGAAAGEHGAVPGVPPARFPAHLSEFDIPMHRTEPAAAAGGLPRAPDPRFFGAPHRLVLSQLVAAVKRNALAHERQMHATEQRRDFRAPAHVMDVGAGAGAASEFMASELAPLEGREVYAIDLCDEAYQRASLLEFGHDALADVAPTSYAQLCANLTGPESITIMRCAAATGIRTLARFDIRLVLVYLDADLHYGRAREAIAEIRRLFPDALLAGGGWDLSTGVQRAVQEAAAAEPALALHVEQGRAWTLHGRLVRQTGNGTALPVVSAEAAAAAEALRIDDGSATLVARKRIWFASVNEALEAGDDVAALRAAVGSHGFPPPAVGAAPDAAAATLGPGDGGSQTLPAADSEVWINDPGDDKRHLNLLMHASKRGRRRCVAALLEEFGADVNCQAPRSLFTALHLAAFEGHAEVVRVLLDHGANPRLVNKYGEDCVKVAARHPAIAAMIAAHLR